MQKNPKISKNHTFKNIWWYLQL